MTKEDMLNCRKRIEPYIHNTPVLTSELINKLTNSNIFFKCENFQKIGAFKMRGAANAVLQLTDEQKVKGVITHSSGNFAQALSLAAKNAGIKAYIVMPAIAAQVKKDAVRSYGGQIFESEPTMESRSKITKKIIEETGATYIHSSDDVNVILGQGTACAELLEDHPYIDHIITPVGGGGLLAGTALAAKYFGKNCKVFAGEPFEADDAYRSIKSGKIETNKTTNTIAEGLKTNLGVNNFPVIQQSVEKIIRVTEKEIIDAMKLIWERMKIVIEPSSAVAFAALLKRNDLFESKKTGVILSGGNVDLKNLPF